jgi:hypothetical protein
VEPQTHRLLVEGEGVLEEAVAEEARESPADAPLIPPGGQVEEGSAVGVEAEADVATGQGDALHELLDVAELGLLGTQELAPGRRVVEQVAHLHRGALRVGGRGRLASPVAAIGAHAPGPLRALCPGADLQARDGSDARQRLAAEAEGGNRLQVGKIADLTGGVARERQGQVLHRDAGAVVTHPQELDPSLPDLDLDAVGAGVEGIFDQLLGHGGGALHHLPGGDLIDQLNGEQLDTVAHGGMESERPGGRKDAGPHQGSTPWSAPVGTGRRGQSIL